MKKHLAILAIVLLCWAGTGKADTTSNDPPMPNSYFQCFAGYQYTLVNGIIRLLNIPADEACWTPLLGAFSNFPFLDLTAVYNWQQASLQYPENVVYNDQYLVGYWNADNPNLSTTYPYTFVYKAPTPTATPIPVSTPTPVSTPPPPVSTPTPPVPPTPTAGCTPQPPQPTPSPMSTPTPAPPPQTNAFAVLSPTPGEMLTCQMDASVVFGGYTFFAYFYIDGHQVSTFQPGMQSFLFPTSFLEQYASGSHALEFIGSNGQGQVTAVISFDVDFDTTSCPNK